MSPDKVAKLMKWTQVDTSFPFLPQGWSVDVRNGQYWAAQNDGTRLGSTSGNVSLPVHRGSRCE